ncbi:MAG: NADH-quinone oxidoreductase subunit C [Bacteroidota bacterium]|nr:NADH-quinone oxidoreductase subunit C [Bacteroidota bacterium]
MTNEELKSTLGELIPSATFEEGGEWVNLYVPLEEWKPVALQLRNHPSLQLDYLFCLTCVDWKTHFTIVYHLSSTAVRHNIVVKVKVDRNNPTIETVSDIWRTAEFHEREVYDLFGVTFLHHPDLRRLIMPDDWKGWPLRKDYEDPVNMIKL